MSIDFPKVIEIQTTNACNSQCICCPHQETFLELGNMQKSLFSKILKEVGKKEILLVPYLNAEPFCDPFFFDRLEKINKFCPYAKIEISTNLSLLDPEKIDQLSQYAIDDLRLSIFGIKKTTYKKMMPNLSWEKVRSHLDYLLENRGKIKKIGMVMLKFPGIKDREFLEAKKFCERNKIEFNLWKFIDRANNVKKYSNHFYQEKTEGCSQHRPTKRFHIVHDGKVILCCQDWRQQYVLGNVKHSSIQEIWNGEEYKKIREQIDNPEKESPKICQHCILSKKFKVEVKI